MKGKNISMVVLVDKQGNIITRKKSHRLENFDRFVENLTLGSVIVAGKKYFTEASLWQKRYQQLPIMMTSKTSYEDGRVYSSFEDEYMFYDFFNMLAPKDCYVLGGVKTIKRFLPYTKTIYYCILDEKIEARKESEFDLGKGFGKGEHVGLLEKDLHNEFDVHIYKYTRTRYLRVPRYANRKDINEKNQCCVKCKSCNNPCKCQQPKPKEDPCDIKKSKKN